MPDEPSLSKKIWDALGKIHAIFWLLGLLAVSTLLLTAVEDIRHHLNLMTVVIIDLLALLLIVAGIVYQHVRERPSSSVCAAALTQTSQVTLERSIHDEKTISNSFTPKVQVLSVSPDDSIDPKIVYKSKVRITLQNDSDQPLEIKGAFWIADGSADLQLPPKLVFRTETESGEWSKDESAGVYVRVNQKFSTWIGLREKLSESKFLQMRERRQFGTLALKISNYSQDYRIQI